ncbi:hypothetical protein LF1_58330 [Rubripirellula obstinata]|uniref:Uncharacterized protein n=1 Tax=Rubripirellula obstinata TaxID=406547 RepID=A0A5B1CBD5_9BACT|nr:hypothetical protein LF1_58330 [Rubripirellula obstinata]
MLEERSSKIQFACGVLLVAAPLVRYVLVAFDVLPLYTPGQGATDVGRAYIRGSNTGANVGSLFSAGAGIAPSEVALSGGPS